MKRFIIAVMFSAMATFATDARATNITTVNFQSSGTISNGAIHIDW